MVRWKLNRELPAYWDGSIHVAGVELHWSGPVNLRGVVLRDSAGREWLRIADLQASLGGISSFQPVVTDLSARGVEIRAYCDAGECRPPWKSQGYGAAKYLDVRTVTIEDATVAVFNEQGSVWRQDGFRFSARRRGDGYDVLCSRRRDDSPDRFAFTGRYGPGGASGLAGQGLIHMENTGIRLLPVVSGIVTFLSLGNGAAGTCGLEATFDLAGSRATLRRGRLASTVVALDAQEGGSVDLSEGMLDLYVVAAPLADVRSLLPSLPPVGVLGQLTDELFRTMDIFSVLTAKLTRLHIQGHWNDPPEKLITKEPLKDLRIATVEFIRQAIETGGRLPAGTLNVFGEVLKSGTARPSPASGPSSQ